MTKTRYYFASIFQLLTGMRPRSLIMRFFLRLPTPSNPVISLPRQAVRLKVRGVMDIWSIKETFLDRFYERFGTAVSAGWSVMDIGGGIGDYTLFAARSQPQVQVHAFEPVPQSFSLLQENLSLNQAENAHAYPFAVWHQPGPLQIDASAGEPGQFISRSISDGATASQKVLVEAIPLAEAFDKAGVDRCDLLKVDCEGAEYPIFFHTPVDVLQRIDRIVMEYHDNITEYTHNDLVKFLAEKGYIVRTYPNFAHHYLGYLYAFRK
jgi:FkbM family methyltransferase